MRKWTAKDWNEVDKRQLRLFDLVTDLAITAAREIAQHIAATVKPWWIAFTARITATAPNHYQLSLLEQSWTPKTTA